MRVDVGLTAGLTGLPAEKRERGQGKDMLMSEGERELVCRGGAAS